MTDIKEFPFPAVTICNMNQVKRNFAEGLTKPQDKIILESICTQGDNLPSDENSNFEGRWSYVRDFLVNSSQKCDEMLKMCKFAMRTINCDKSFATYMTDEGLCCTFNGIHPKFMFKDYHVEDFVPMDFDEIDYITWTPENGYTEKSNKSHYPRPVQGAGSNMGLTLMLDADVANYYCSSTSSSGFKILLHSPAETPKMSNFAFSVATGQETKIVITPRISEASAMIRKIPMQQRQCIFEGESNLSFYKIYSKKNCEMECSSKTMKEKCGCTLYYMPRDFNNNDTKICNRRQAPCYEQVLFDISYSLNEMVTCNYCLPACFEVNYGRELSSSKLGGGEFLTEYSLKGYNKSFIHANLAIVHIYFMDNAYRGFTKNELIGFTEFLSNTGGLLGLFMGFSVISLIEIVYFLSLRPYCARKIVQRQKEKVVGVELLVEPKIASSKQKVHPTLHENLTRKIVKLWESVKKFINEDESDNDLPPYPYCN